MCLIIDNNVVHLVFRQTPSEDYIPIVKALTQRKAKAVYGGYLVEEYKLLRTYFKIILEFDRQGMMRKINDTKVNDVTTNIEKRVSLKSDDPHIIALALVSNARLLCSEDKDLAEDFTNKEILNPRGKVYRKKTHAHLIRKHCECYSSSER